MIDLPVDIVEQVSAPSLADEHRYPIRSNLSRSIEDAAHPLVANLNIRVGVDSWSGYESMNSSLENLHLEGHPITRVFWCGGLPYAYFIHTKEFVRLMTLHFQGPAKKYIYFYGEDISCDCVCDSSDCRTLISFAEYRNRFADTNSANSLESFCRPWNHTNITRAST